MKKIEHLLSTLQTKSFPNLLDIYSGEINHLTREIKQKVIYISGHDFFYFENEELSFQTTCITSQFWYGHLPGSYKTPTGLHMVSECIWEWEDLYQKFERRIPTVIETPVSFWELKPWVYGRILRLDGMENQNKGTRSRWVYIHGNIHDWYWESADLKRSYGCVGLKLSDIKEIFDHIYKTKQRVLVYIESNEEKIWQD